MSTSEPSPPPISRAPIHTSVLRSGSIRYRVEGPEDAPPVVLLHGPLMNGTVWDGVVDRLRDRHRCFTPTLPLGGHDVPMDADADLSIRGVALLVEEFLAERGLSDVTLVLNDWGGAQVLVSERRTERVGRVVLTSCEAFDNYPPGKAGRTLRDAARVPGGLWLLSRLSGMRAFRRAPNGWGAMSRRPIPDATMDAWFAPMRAHRLVRRDLRKYLLSVPSRETLLAWSEAMRGYADPVLIVWAAEDELMPPEHGPRLAGLFPDARLVELDDCRTLIPIDRPEALAAEIARFVGNGTVVQPLYPRDRGREDRPDRRTPSR
ncbi:alpha/beta fold hydrolase [Phytomonospora endophytica]|uniref:Pimeloyl-ACP methyl ester carboxylesterase n=1 Tax=Phytomonospora endophytica TaxID=714109 RepID=A0A841FRW2_9ACTN|nr:alpha/beta hydrolase [Phytomonospora endophytica]MBB6035289.1 pimeloyl-ACP methyl ester carboxylesterase [Phytomonospora endophytica]GIG63962.1 oxidoreductase [Phytomonospora endophytica]